MKLNLTGIQKKDAAMLLSVFNSLHVYNNWNSRLDCVCYKNNWGLFILSYKYIFAQIDVTLR